VQRGYGRGSKKLGFPTANLPEDLFQSTLADVPAGVYSCFAVVGDEPQLVRPAVANVGYSPTFAEDQNKCKIIEAHLLDRSPNEDDDSPADFYGMPLTLLLVAFQRPERKFPDFPTLVRNIKNDVRVAADGLLRLDHLRQHPSLLAASTLVDTAIVRDWIDTTTTV